MLVKFGANAPVLTPSPAANPAITQQEIAPITLTSKPDSVHFGRNVGTMMIMNAYEVQEGQIQAALEAEVDGITGTDYLLTLQSGNDLPESWVESRSKRAIVRDLTRAGLIALNGEEAELTPLGKWIVPNVIWKRLFDAHQNQLAALPNETAIRERESMRWPHEAVMGRDLLGTLRERPIQVFGDAPHAEGESYGAGSSTFFLMDGVLKEMNAFWERLVELKIVSRSEIPHESGYGRKTGNEYQLTPYGWHALEQLGI
jgi:hypothetical protein